MLIRHIIGVEVPPRRGNRLLLTALKCWDKCCKLTHDVPRYAKPLPLTGFPIGSGRGARCILDVEMEPWAEAGNRTVGDLYLDRSLIPLDQLSGIHGTPCWAIPEL